MSTKSPVIASVDEKKQSSKSIWWSAKMY